MANTTKARKTSKPRENAAGPAHQAERHKEVVRQWRLLSTLETSRFGQTVADLAQKFDVTTRTIRRDMDALTMAGFPLARRQTDTGVRWTLDREMFKGLVEAGLSLSELCALYFSRTLAEFMAGMPFHQDLEAAFDKLEGTLTPKMKKYLDGMSSAFGAKPAPLKKRGRKHAASVATLYTAIFDQRTVKMRYYSFHSQAERSYEVEPYRLAFAEGGLYLFAFVPAYAQMRTFAVERVRSVSLTDRHFNPGAPLAADAFGDSMGVNTGKPEPVSVRFTGSAARHVAERVWHKTQRIEEQGDGAVVVHLNVCIDFALKSWILSFGPLAQVLKPRDLAERIYEQLEEARDQYAPRLFPSDAAPGPAHPRLPFSGSRKPSTSRPA